MFYNVCPLHPSNTVYEDTMPEFREDHAHVLTTKHAFEVAQRETGVVENSARPKIQSDPSLSSFTQKGVSEIKAKAFFSRTFGGSGYTGTGFDLVNQSFYGCRFWRAGT
ncbi:hypothetical protein PM082_004474 [Marasmius tenuissimus]|nr:hypothetical protein PM082_004474 [Marasmius tenuissimus]